jgi:serine protease Do
VGDVLVRSRDRAIRNAYDWEAELLELRVGDDVPLVVRRGGREFQASVKIADLPEMNAQRVAVLKEMELVSLTPAIRAERGIVRAQGALVVNVSARVSEDLGIQAGDVIVQVNNSPVADAQQAAKTLEYFIGRGPIRMFFERGGRVFFTDFQLR